MELTALTYAFTDKINPLAPFRAGGFCCDYGVGLEPILFISARLIVLSRKAFIASKNGADIFCNYLSSDY